MTQRPEEIAVVVVTRDGIGWLPECMGSLRGEAGRGLRAILVDNGSSDGTIDWVTKNHPEAEIVRAGRNLGFAAGANLGIERALASGAEWIFLLNDDAAVGPGFFESLRKAAAGHPETMAFAPRIVAAERADTISSAGIALGPDGGARDVLRGEPFERGDGPIREVFGPSGAAALFRRAFFEEVGLFEPGFFAYFEDVDLAWRARHRGLKTLYVPAAIAKHAFARTSGVRSLRRLFWLQRNRLRVIARNVPGAGRALGAAIRAGAALLPSPGAIGRAKAASPFFEAHGKARQAAVYAAAWAAAAGELPRLLSARRRILPGSRLSETDLEWWLSNDFGPPSGRLVRPESERTKRAC